MNSLYELKDNEVAVVESLDSSYDAKVRLAEMGLMVGVPVRMVKKSPFGGPIQVKINNYYLTIRKEDAVLIYMKDDSL